MDIAAPISSFVANVPNLSKELAATLHHGSNVQILNALSNAALEPDLTTAVFTHFSHFALDICARWRNSRRAVICAYGRIVYTFPHVAEIAERVLADVHSDIFADLEHIDINDTRELLLAVHRLLVYDNARFSRFIRPARLQLLLGHNDFSLRYLAIRVLCQYIHASEFTFEEMLKKALGSNGASGQWEDKVIDYTFLPLWEEKRLADFCAAIEAGTHLPMIEPRIVAEEDLDFAVTQVGTVLLPRAHTEQASTLVSTPTTQRNLQQIATALLGPRPILITGLAGTGKTSLIKHIAAKIGRDASMITLHPNEQSDVKLLLGIYSSGKQAGSFEWQPGVLVKAVREGRWVLVEDIDRAPNEIIGTLLPLLERGELLISNRSETVKAAPGFRIVATIRTYLDGGGNESQTPLTRLLGLRLWSHVGLQQPSTHELEEIIRQAHPLISPFVTQLMDAFRRVTAIRGDSGGSGRPITARELFKWANRIHSVLVKAGFQNTGQVGESVLDNIFLDALDCMIGHIQDDKRQNLIGSIAESLHIDPRRRDYLTKHRTIQLQKSSQLLTVGRASFQSSKGSRQSSRFALNGFSLRLLEQVAASVALREPLLLVGETGIGKTSMVQYLSSLLDQKLTVINLSQQSESGDLLGGFKPIRVRSLIMPLKDEFDALFDQVFAQKKNLEFSTQLGKSIAKGQWKRAISLWRVALQRVENTHVGDENFEKTRKRRRLDAPALDRIRSFASKLTAIEQQISAGAAFRFAFAEGNLIRAVRNGHWVLLDEINLATSDTLECLADLLESRAPSIMLAEAGSVEKIAAHPNFRIFGAMNPASDVGKRDLPLGIRSRFTEIFVQSPDSDSASLQSIAEAYLGKSQGLADHHLARIITEVYQDIQSMVTSQSLVDSAGRQPHFSLRTFTRVLSYASSLVPRCSLRRALYEGVCMYFFTALNAPSEEIVKAKVETLLWGDLQSAKSHLRKPLRAPQDTQQFAQVALKIRSNTDGIESLWVPRGALDPVDPADYIVTPYIAKNLRNLVRASGSRHPVLIQGPTSAGKTSMVEYLAKRSGNVFVRINNHEHTDIQEYLGTYTSNAEGQLIYEEGALVTAVRKGHWIVLDELNLAPTDVLEALNRLLDDNRELFIPETQEVVIPHKDFMLFATQNPAGPYGGRKELSRAFRNRFVELHFDDIPVDELNIILSHRSKLPPSWCEKIVEVYKKLASIRQEQRLFERNSFATLRDLFRWAFRSADSINELARNGYMLLAEKVRDEQDRGIVLQVLQSVMNGKGISVTVDSLYDTHSPLHDSGITWTYSMRRLYHLISQAIINDEPVLLVGETGCGKTTVCQLLARAMQKPLHIVNAHQNTETADLIGAQRPLRNRTAIEKELLADLGSWKSSQPGEIASSINLEELLILYDTSIKDGASVEPEIKARIAHNRQRRKTLFEWYNGSLVTSMQSGSFYLLDEISLAEDAVLERINSVLDPQRSILLAEKGSTDSYVVAKAGFQFFATMNPGGDFGKKELSPALRNRFTEIWVPSPTMASDLVPILEDKLLSGYKHFAPAMVDFARWFGERYSGPKATISLRDILSWAAFIEKTSQGLVSVVHGAATVYIDTLGANPAALIALDRRNLEAERSECIKFLGDVLNHDAKTLYECAADISLDNTLFSVGPFSINVMSSSGEEPFYFGARTVQKNLLRIMRAMQLDKPVLLEGDPGVGKTAIITAIAATSGRQLTRINLSEQTDLMDLFGSDTPTEDQGFAWRDAPFLQAMKSGDWVLLDEMNLASQSVLEGLNACLDHRGEAYIAELDQTFRRHDNFRLFAAQNPHAQGGGRKGLPASYVNRFTVVYADVLQQDDLEHICSNLFPEQAAANLSHTVSCVVRLNESITNQKFGMKGAPWEFNLRDMLRWLSLQGSSKFLSPNGAQDFVDLLFLHRFRTRKDVELAKCLFEEQLGSWPSVNRSVMYTPNYAQIGMAVFDREALTDSELCFSDNAPVMESLLMAVRERWPVLLVGAGGSGKSSLIKSAAMLCGANLQTFAMHSEVDASDMVGSFEQADAYRGLQNYFCDVEAFARREAARQLLSTTPEKANQALDLLHTNTGALNLVHILGYLDTHGSGSPQEAGLLLERGKRFQNSAKFVEMSQFEWIDGILVQALKQGHWLVMDNVNLCSSAVLDRLNSLLEPNGSLIVNENCESDGTARVLRPHPNFRIFMTMDPRYGEVSRAMRNRAVELYVNDTPHTGDNIYHDSSVLRFRQLLKWSDNTIVANARSDMSLAASSILLNTTDIGMLERLQMQVASGLSSADALKLVSQLYNGYRVLHALGTWPESKARLQRVLPIHSDQEAIVKQFATKAIPLESMLKYGKIADVLFKLVPMIQAINQVKQTETSSSSMTRLQRALTPKLIAGSRNSWNVGEFLQLFIDKFAAWVVSLDPATHPLFDIVNRDHDEVTYQSALLLGYDVAKEASHNLTDLNTQSAVSWAQRRLIHGRTVTGLSTEAIWSKFKPAVPSDTATFNSFQSMCHLASTVDKVIWQVEVPLLDKFRIRQCMEQALVDTISGSQDVPVEELKATLQDLESSVDEQNVAVPEFQRSADLLCRLQAISPSATTQELELLAGRSSTDKMITGQPASAALSNLARFSDASGSDTLFPDQVMFEVIRTILRALDRYQSELNVIGDVLASRLDELNTGADDHLRSTLFQLLESILEVLHPLAEEHEDMMTQHQKLWRTRDRLCQSASTWVELGEIMIEIAITALKLFLPTNPFDPALKAHLRVQLYDHTYAELSNELEMLQFCEDQPSGVSAHYRIVNTQSSMLELGERPALAQIFRPTRSRIPELQIVFDNILRIVQQLQSFSERGTFDFSQSFVEIIARLKSFSDYLDLASPATAFLQILQMGMALSKRKVDQMHGGRCVPFTNSPLDLSDSQSDTDGVNLEISALVVGHFTANTWSRHVFDRIAYGFGNRYTRWKMQLERDQRKHQTASSLYVYRGGHDDDEASMEREFLDMFPSFDGNEEPVEQKWDAQHASVECANLHALMFRQAIPAADVLEALVLRLSRQDARERHMGGLGGVDGQAVAALLSLYDKQQSLAAGKGSAKGYNIYKDPNVSEIRSLRYLLYKIQARFRILVQAWPEHVTLHDVLEFCQTSLSCSHSDPLMKILPKLEQLHGHLYQWQSVASAEYSANEEYNATTDLIVRWRQLELSTWAGLLDAEIDKAADDAKSFWFLAYEVTHANEIEHNAQSLAQALQEFIQSSSIGQFGQRLAMLQTFLDEFQLSSKFYPQTRPIAAVISNVCNHFAVFTDVIRGQIIKSRSERDQKIRTVLQLASWRDRNITALRQSAKSSHEKLFRIIRKFRSFLSSPVQSFITQRAVPSPKQFAEDRMHFAMSIDQAALAACSTTFEWASRPMRLKNVIETATLLRDKAKPEDTRTQRDLTDFLDGLDASAKALLKETPAELTEENSVKAKHVTAQKRRLYAETLKELRTMGLRQNPPAVVVDAQDTLAKLLSRVASLINIPSGFHDFHASNLHLHSLFDLIPQIRTATHEHHEDLSSAEIARSIGLAESHLALCLRSRQSSVAHISNALRLEHELARANGTWQEKLLVEKQEDHQTETTFEDIRWLKTIMIVGRKALEAQAKLGDLNFTDLLGYVDGVIQELDMLSSEASAGPECPGLVTFLHREFLNKAMMTMSQLSSSLESWTQIHPQTRPILAHVSAWLSQRRSLEASTSTPTVSLTAFQSMQVEAFDLVLGAIQDVAVEQDQRIFERPEAGWLVESVKKQERVLKAFQSERVLEAMAQIHGQLRAIPTERNAFQVACALTALSAPILQSYTETFKLHSKRLVCLYEETCRSAHLLFGYFLQISTQGFCRPSEKSEESAKGSDGLESGTGLGEGEGAEDISKDIGKDEDLSELAQDTDNQSGNNEINNTDDAIDIEDALEGGAGEESKDADDEETDNLSDNDDGSTADSDFGSTGAGEGAQEDEDQGANPAEDDVGDVDDLGPSAVDEKMWDNPSEDATKQKETSQKADDTSRNEQTSSFENPVDQEAQDGEEETDYPSDGGSEHAIQESEALDPNLKESEAMDLPDDLNLEGKASDTDDPMDDSLSELSDMEEQEADNAREQSVVSEVDQMSDTGHEDNTTAEQAQPDEPEDGKPKDHEHKDDNSGTVAENDDMTANEQQSGGHGESDAKEAEAEQPAGVGAEEEQTEEESNQNNGETSQRQSGVESKALESQVQRGVNSSSDAPRPERAAAEAFKKLGDVLEKWHRQRKEIHEPTSDVKEDDTIPQDVDMANADFEHLPDDQAQADAQAMGASSKEQARGMDDSMAIDLDDMKNELLPDQPRAPEALEESISDDEDVDMDAQEPVDSIFDSSHGKGAHIPDANETDQENTKHDQEADTEDEVLDEELTNMTLLTRPPSPDVFQGDSASLWNHYASSMQTLSQTLTEQLRLILAPTRATKLRGDFRTGKRLNIKRIIPYIASSYKRDKIWMRRSVPSKRAYQVMLAIDDSHSMAERLPLTNDKEVSNDSDRGSRTRASLAFATLALLATSLTSLEVGEVSVLGFGAETFVAHDFDQPFSPASGAETLSKFSFKQDRTDVRKLMETSLAKFAQARLQAAGSSSQDLWQLMLVISDGICEDHEQIRRLLVQAQEQRILVVFVIVDNAAARQGIADLERVEFDTDDAGGPVIRRQRYLDTFPFRYFLIVRQVESLPSVLAGALRQWFAEVAG